MKHFFLLSDKVFILFITDILNYADYLYIDILPKRAHTYTNTYTHTVKQININGIEC